MEEHDHDEPLATEREAAIAEHALASGDPVHAAHHLANVLFDTAGDDTYLRLARRVLDAATLDTLIVPDDTRDRRVLMEAVLLHLLGRDAEGLKLLAMVAAYCRDLRIERWLAPWIRDAREPLDPAAFSQYLMLPARTTVGRMHLRPAEVRFAEDVASVADALLEREDTGRDAALLASAASVYRRAGRLEDAIAAAEASVSAAPSDVPLTMLALAKRAAGDWEGARLAFERANAIYAISREADLARIAWDAGDLEGALTLFERADPERTDPEINLCVQWLRHALADRPQRLGLWERMKRGVLGAKPPRVPPAVEGAAHEARVGRALHPDDAVLLPQPFVGWLPERRDASINALREMLAKGLTFGRTTVTHMEAPSVRLAIAWSTDAVDAATVDYHTLAIADDPDPREPWDDVPFVLWRYEDDVPFPALPRPGGEVLRAVQALAELPFYLPRWWEEAGRVGPSLGPAHARELAAAMVHAVRDAPIGMPAWTWLQRQQLAAALLIARVEPRPTADGAAWLTLEAILCGPHDWAVEAAIIAAAELAFDHPHFERLVCATFESLLDNAPREGDICWDLALRTVLPRLPRVSGYLRERCAPHGSAGS